MSNIVVATGPSDRADPLLRIGTSIAERTRGDLTRVRVDRSRPAGAHPFRLGFDDLLLVDPCPPGRGAGPGLDPTIERVIRRSTAPTLAVRAPIDWPPRRVLVAFDEPGLASGVLQRVAALIASTCLDEHPSGTVDVELVFLSDHPDGLHAGLPSARQQTDALRERLGSPATAQLRACVRWGATPHRRILRWLERSGPDLAILSSTAPATERPGEVEHWVRVLSYARCSVLLLPDGAGAPDPSGNLDRMQTLPSISRPGWRWKRAPSRRRRTRPSRSRS